MVSARKLVGGEQGTQVTWSEQTILTKITLKDEETLLREEEGKESSRQRKSVLQDPEAGRDAYF